MVGRRKERGFLRLPALVAPFGIPLFSTDGWGTYERHGDTEQHAGGKEPRQRIERAPITWRTRIPRRVRRTICFSQTEWRHDLVIGPFINRMSAGERSHMSATTLHHLLFPDTYRTKSSRSWGHV